MSNLELFSIWAPDDRVWSQWAKPVLFAHCGSGAVLGGQIAEWPRLDAPNDRSTALIIDLPREMSVDFGIAAARDEYWPVPLFNCAFGPGAILNVQMLIDRLVLGARELQRIAVPINACPAFLIDSKRMLPDGPLHPGSFDNRYVLLPQDFPSAGFLKAHGITRAVWIRTSRDSLLPTPARNPKDDLAHVLCRWQEGGIELHATDISTHRTEPIHVSRPSGFRSLFYRAFALMGLRRNSAGGFGGIIPHPSSGG